MNENSFIDNEHAGAVLYSVRTRRRFNVVSTLSTSKQRCYNVKMTSPAYRVGKFYWFYNIISGFVLHGIFHTRLNNASYSTSG